MKEIEYRRVEELTLLEDNPRKISVEQMERLKESIDKNPDYFECRPVILSDRTGELVVIAGNQRVKAATAIGLEAVPTILLSGLSEEREKEIIIRDNVNNGEWDEELLADWDAALLDDWGVDISALSEKDFLQVGEENREAIDDNYKIPKNAPSISKEGDIFKLGEHRLICGDSTDAGVIADLMAGEMADLIVTDPPYNVAYEGGTKDKLTIDNDNMSSPQFFEFLYKAFQAASNALKSGGGILCMVCRERAYKLRECAFSFRFNSKADTHLEQKHICPRSARLSLETRALPVWVERRGWALFHQAQGSVHRN